MVYMGISHYLIELMIMATGYQPDACWYDECGLLGGSLKYAGEIALSWAISDNLIF